MRHTRSGPKVFAQADFPATATSPGALGPVAAHRLALAGRSDTLFSDDAVALIHQTSRGYPRAVNNLALQALVAGTPLLSWRVLLCS